MTTRLDELAQRRLRLQMRCQLQRDTVSALAEHIESRLSGFDRGFRFVDLLTKRPVMIAAGIAGAFFLGPKRMLRWFGQGTLLIGIARKLFGLFAR